MYSHSAADDFSIQRASSTTSQNSAYALSIGSSLSSKNDPAEPLSPVSPISSTSTGSTVYNHPLARRPHPHMSLMLPHDFSIEALEMIDHLGYDDEDDKGLIANEINFRRREQLVKQIHQSERQYNAHLKLILTKFMKPLVDNKGQADLTTTRNRMICTEREIGCLFGNMLDILSLQRRTLRHLEERLRIWGPTQILSDIFQSWIQSIHLYEAYFENYRLAITTYEQLRQFPAFRKFMDTVHLDPSLEGATLPSLLQLPASCPSRYAQLISKLVEHTSPLHPDYAHLTQCRQDMLLILDRVKHMLQAMDNMDQVVLAHHAIVGAPFNIKLHRQLIHCQQPIPGEPRTIILFSDMIVFCRQSKKSPHQLQYKNHIEMVHMARVALLPDENNAIQITAFNHDRDIAPTIHVMRTTNPQDWIQWLQRAIYLVNPEAEHPSSPKPEHARKQSSASETCRTALTVEEKLMM
ncbi:Dbl homology domain-containing protein [Dichotomocladium elegans]|nr:Dbl homology domain-containing protein [Dichotomocladium elegans]